MHTDIPAIYTFLKTAAGLKELIRHQGQKVVSRRLVLMGI